MAGQPLILFRCDASPAIGFGHLTRSAYFAEHLRKNHQLLFITGTEKQAAIFLKEKKLASCSLKKAPALLASRPAVLILDLPAFGAEDLTLLESARAAGIFTIQITDLGLVQQPVDLTIDAAWTAIHPYPSGRPALLGPQYAILHHKFRHFNQAKRRYHRKLRTIFITLGGGAVYRRLRSVIEGLKDQHFQLKVAGGFSITKAHKRVLKRIYPRLHWVGRTQSLARSFYEADTALITSGTAAFEAAACGTPALYLHYNSFQEAHADAFEQAGCGLKVGPIDQVSPSAVRLSLQGLDLATRTEMGQSGRRLVDGLGIYRILKNLQERGYTIQS